MITTGIDLASLIRNLAAIDAASQLDTLFLDWAADCRGRCDDAAHIVTANELLHAQRVANALVLFCRLTKSDAQAAVRSVLLPHPRRESGIRLVEEYTRATATFDKLQRERAKA